MAKPWQHRSPDSRLSDIKFARDREEERSAGLDEEDARRQMQLEQAMQREQARAADLDRQDGIQEEMRFEQKRAADLDVAGAPQYEPGGRVLPAEAAPYLREMIPRWERETPYLGPEGQEYQPLLGVPGEPMYEPTGGLIPTDVSRRMAPGVRAAQQMGPTPWAPGNILTEMLRPLEQADYPRRLIKEKLIEPVVPDFALKIPGEVVQAAIPPGARDVVGAIGAIGGPTVPDVTITDEFVEEAASWILDPLNLLPAVGWGPDIIRAAKKGVPALKLALKKSPQARSFLDDVLRTGERGGPRVPGGLGAEVGELPDFTDTARSLLRQAERAGQEITPQTLADARGAAKLRGTTMVEGHHVAEALQYRGETVTALRARGADKATIERFQDVRKAAQSEVLKQPELSLGALQRELRLQQEAYKTTPPGPMRESVTQNITDLQTRMTRLQGAAPRVPGVGPEDVARVTPEPELGGFPARFKGRARALEGGPPRPPRKPPTGPRGPDPDDAQFRRIQDVAIKGEKPEMTLIRRHEGALQTARREAQIQVEEGNRLLRDANLGQSFRGTVAPRAGQTDEFDELYRFLHNPSRVEAGELVVPERLRPAYNKLRELTDWEQAARIDFDPEMALIEDYFYRGWKPPEGMFAEGAPTRGPLGRKPGFRLPRVDATFEEMRAAGFEPLHWNPFEQWRNSRMMGVRYREQMRLVEDIKSLGLAEVHTGGPIPEGWRVPRVGSAFEGKPFAVVDEAGGARPMFTRRWIVPDTMADRLENIYGVAPQLGTVELAGRAVNLARVVDALVFIPKRAKLIASVFQHVDFLTRSHLGAWTGMVDALRHGRPISAVKHLAVWPNSARKILQATVSPGYRQNLRRMALDTSPLVPGRPGLTMRSVSEAGLSLQDVTILPANIDQIAREVAQEAVAAKVIKAPPRALAGFERVHRQGLFQGVYPAAILTDVQNNIAPIMVRNYPHLTDAQLAGQVAKVASTKYSTIPASMSAVQNRTLRGVLTRTFFSMGETEGLLRQATGALRGPQAAFWRDHWLGVYVGLIATANAIHFASTGEPLPFARYSPVSRNKWGPLPIGYNRDFASPNIPLTGRSGTEITLDLVGQLDTAFRILDPASFIGARESVPVRTAVNQIKGTDFFGAPIDEVGPGGIVSRTSQLIFDMFAPIGVGQAALQLARENIQGAERIIRPGEDRLGTAGTAVQATGVNLRAETTPQLLDRIRAEVMQEKGIEGRYEDIKATDAPLANEINDEVETRIGPELELRRETAEIRGQATPQGQFFGEQEVSREQQKEEQLADDVKLSSGQWEGDVWRDKFRDRQRDFYNRREGLKQAFKIEFEDKEAPSGSINAAIDAYFDVNIDDYAQPDGETNWDGFFEAQEKALAPLSSKDKSRVMEFLRKYDTPTIKEFRKAEEVVDRFYSTPKYKGLSVEQGEEVDRVLYDLAPALQTRFEAETGEKLSRRDAVRHLAAIIHDKKAREFLLEHFGGGVQAGLRRIGEGAGLRRITDVRRETDEIRNEKRDQILIDNERLLARFYNDLLERELSREQEAGLLPTTLEALFGPGMALPDIERRGLRPITAVR